MISSGIWILFYLYEYFAFMLVLSDVCAHCFVFPARFQQGNTTVLILVRRNCCKLVWIVHNSIKHKVWGYLIYLRCLSIQRLCCQRQATHTRVPAFTNSAGPKLYYISNHNKYLPILTRRNRRRVLRLVRHVV